MNKKIFITLLVILGVSFIASCGRYYSNGKDGFGAYDYIANSSFNGEKTDWSKSESFSKVTENPIYVANLNNESYFSMDSFKASYTNLRRYIDNKQMIDGSAIKTDELLNYFNYDTLKVEEGNDFAMQAELHDCPWNSENQLLTVKVQSREQDVNALEGNNIVFLIDVSGSMSDVIGLVKKSFKLFAENVGKNDVISIITYCHNTKIVDEGVKGEDASKLIKKVNKIVASGSTNGGDALKAAYKLCKKYFIKGGNNRVIIASDGDFNVGYTSQNDLKELIQTQAEDNIYLTTLGYGMGNYRDTTMETLAKYGNGNYGYIDSLNEAKRVLVDDLAKTMFTVAKDVKNKIEFNSEIVSEYRLIGYENKGLSEDEFNNEQTDAGEIESGHQTIVCYELKLNKQVSTDTKVASLQINYKDPITSESKTYADELIVNSNSLVTEEFMFAASIIEFSLVLKNSPYKNNANIDNAIKTLSSLNIVKEDSSKSEFYELVATAKEYELYSKKEYIQVTILFKDIIKKVNFEYKEKLTVKLIYDLMFIEQSERDKYSIYHYIFYMSNITNFKEMQLVEPITLLITEFHFTK